MNIQDMENQFAIGVDIGGSHITSSVVDLSQYRILSGTRCSKTVNNKADKEEILKDWAEAINRTIANSPISKIANIGFAMPGPFDYKTGLALFKGNDKFDGLYNVSIPDEFPAYIKGVRSTNFRFMNDATSFGVGASVMGRAKDHSKVLAITLGTGFGSAFIRDGIPLINEEGVPEGGWLWDKPYKDGIGDDYFSTRWCLKRYQQISYRQVQGVKEIAEIDNEHTRALFEEFGSNMAEFMIPFLLRFKPDLIILGGNISKAQNFFLPTLMSKIRDTGLHMEFRISELMEDAAIIGSAKLFEPNFWARIK